MAACLTAPPQPPPPPPVVATVNDTVAPEAVADADAVDGATDGELTAALQKAVVALGYDASLATRRDLVALFGRIAGGAPFPPASWRLCAPRRAWPTASASTACCARKCRACGRPLQRRCSKRRRDW
eukprot:TRINITY_DN6362_c0_g1_i2.p4 TRINITY_DN6362_c0_g1~~TRINITY_DN6362_c0_g1_i2.p4  ORF type:complete len:127 (-),score=29.45 TRINITY_DN6362_c0_g1_i2:369-749(-)